MHSVFRKLARETITINPEKDSFLENAKLVKADKSFQAGHATRWDKSQQESWATSVLINNAPSPFVFADVERCLQAAIERESVEDIEYYQSWADEGIVYLNIDSNNRVLNTISFLNGEFGIQPARYETASGSFLVVAGKNDTYDTLPSVLREQFDASEITVEVYTDATREELSDLFIRINDGRPLNAAEKRNAKTSKIASVIRDLAAKYHDRFVGDDIEWIGVKEANRRAVDDFIAALAYIYFNGIKSTISETSLWDMYELGGYGDKQSTKFKTTFTNFMDKFANDDDLKAIPNKNSILDLWTIYVSNKNKNLVIKSGKNSEFISKFIDVVGTLIISKDLHEAPEGYSWKSPKTFDKAVGGRQAANNVLRNNLITNQIDMKEFFKESSTGPRTATNAVKLGAAVKQKWTTPEGKKIVKSKLNDGKTYHKGHIVADVNGGDATIENTVVQTAEDNLKLGGKDLVT